RSRINQHADLVLVVEHVAVFPVEQIHKARAVWLIVDRGVAMASGAALGSTLTKTVDRLGHSNDVWLDGHTAFEAGGHLLPQVTEVVPVLLDRGLCDLHGHSSRSNADKGLPSGCPLCGPAFLACIGFAAPGAFRLSACHRRPAHCWDACDVCAWGVSVSRLFDAGISQGGVACCTCGRRAHPVEPECPGA